MPKFKVGDRVILRTTGIKGSIYSLDSCGVYVDPDDRCGARYEYFEEVKKLKPKRSELQRLVDRVNAGKDALREIHQKYHQRTLHVANPIDMYTHIEIIPEPKKPKFEPYKIGDWEVKVRKETLYIGCRNFPLKQFKANLKLVLQVGGILNPTYCHHIKASKAGLVYGFEDYVQSLEYTLKWADAETLLKKLEAAGIK